MFKNYVTTAFRNLIRNKLYSVINIGGLAIGLAVCILIFMFVRDEFSFDKFFSDADRIYRVEATITLPGRDAIEIEATQPIFAETLKADFSQIEDITRFDSSEESVALQDKRFFHRVAAVDQNFLEIFDFELIEGNPETVLNDPSSIVLTEDMAKKFFGDQDPIGQTLTINAEKEFRVTGVLKNVPADTHFDFEALRPLNPVDYGENYFRWGSFNLKTYIKLKKGADIKTIRADLPSFVDRNLPTTIFDNIQESASSVLQYSAVPLTDIHFYSFGGTDVKPKGDLATVYGFSVIALLILGIAIINFVNLATARFAGRIKEVAIRKVVGASRKQLVTQYLAESTGVVIIALILAIFLVESATPWFAGFFQDVNTLGAARDPYFLAAIAGLAVVVGLGSGFYPSLYLSKIPPSRALNAGSAKDSGSFRLRTILVVFQFSISIALVIGTGAVYSQMNYMQNLDLGFETENILVIRNITPPQVAPSMAPFMNALRNQPEVVSLSRSNGVPGDRQIRISRVTYPGNASDQPLIIRSRSLDFDYLEAYGIEPITGRIFDLAIISDAVALEKDERWREAASAVVNQSALRFLNLGSPEEAIGKIFTTSPNREDSTQWTVIGVVPDMHDDSLRNAIEPMFYAVDLAGFSTLSIHFKTDNLGGFLKKVDGLWNRHIPGVPITRDFLDDTLAAFYAEDEARNSVLILFAILAILVSSLGLFGLASFTAERRTKEVGIRKVAGASTPDIVRLLVWQFSKPVLIANLIAGPIAWYFINNWLTGFAYRIELSFLYFVAAGLLALLIAWGTVAGHAWKVARSNPIKALRYE